MAAKLRAIEFVDVKKVRTAIKELNDSGLAGETKLRVIAKTEDLVKGFTDAVKKIAKEGKEDKIPESVVQIYNYLYSPPTDEEKKTTAEKKEKKNKPKKEPGPKSRYGHKAGTQSEILDELFYAGTTIKDAAAKINGKEARVKSHLDHLKKDKKLTVEMKTEEGKPATYKVKEEKCVTE